MAALALLEEPVLDILVGSSIAFDDLPAKLPSILDHESEGMCPLIRYPAADESS